MNTDAYELNRMRNLARLYSRFLGSGYERYCSPPEELESKNPENWEWARQWDHGSVICYGPEGTGKSSLARHLVCRHVAAWHDSTDWDDMHYSAMDLYCPDLENAVRDHSHEGRRQLTVTIDRAKYVGLLLLDDLDRAQWTRAGLDALRAIINHRHERQKSTITTLNMHPKQLTAAMTEWHGGDSDGAISLLRRFRPAKGLEFKGDSYRRIMK